MIRKTRRLYISFVFDRFYFNSILKFKHVPHHKKSVIQILLSYNWHIRRLNHLTVRSILSKSRIIDETVIFLQICQSDSIELSVF